MVKAASKNEGVRVDDAQRVLLNIIPTDVAETAELRIGASEAQESPTLTPELFPEQGHPLSTAKTEPLQLTKAPPPPKKARTGLLVALSMGGGVLLGSGAVTALAALGALFAVVGAVVVLTLWLVSAAPVPVAVELPVVVPSAEIENPAAEMPVADPVTPATDISAGGSPTSVTPAEGTAGAPVSTPKPAGSPAGSPAAPSPAAPAPAATAPAAPTAPAPAAPAAPAPATPAPAAPAPAPAAPAPAKAAPSSSGLVLVKIISDPPAALLSVDGAGKGRTPTKIELEPGTYEISLTLGSSKGSFSIDVAPGDDKFCYGLSGKKIVRTSCD